ncbi:hypothetical protein NOVO_07850 [Rickettsiales bacterium Ac37b]|nr:hypothetical protein NOVO_07850 [Rickettsiales bacterium Ac37b]
MVSIFGKHIFREDLLSEEKDYYKNFFCNLDKDKNLTIYKTICEEYELYINKNIPKSPELYIYNEYDPKVDHFHPTSKRYHTEHVLIGRQKESKQTCQIS